MTLDFVDVYIKEILNLKMARKKQIHVKVHTHEYLTQTVLWETGIKSPGLKLVTKKNSNYGHSVF